MNELGDLRASQLIYTFGVGAVLDLPNTSVLILGLDDWDMRYCTEIEEERLVGAIQKRLGSQMKKLYLPPIAFDDDNRDPTAPAVGVPVAPFPRWLRCPLCNTLATIDSGVFKLVQDKWRPDRTRFVHENCGRLLGNIPPTALPVRFLLACREGHLSDFLWVEYVHDGRKPCMPARLTLREFGASGDASDIIVACLECNAERRMGDAFDRARFPINCSAHHPHLRMVETSACQEEARTILLGASNSWFPLVMSALTLPASTEDKLGRLIDENWTDLKDIPSLEVVRYVTAPSRMPTLVGFSAEQIWAAINQRKSSSGQSAQQENDLKVPEWNVLTEDPSLPGTKDFQITRVSSPANFESSFEPTGLLEKLREVRALLAFTRIESRGDFADGDNANDDRQTPLSRQSPSWLPASEVRGEGLFLRLREDVLQAWEQKSQVRQVEKDFLQSYVSWRRLRKITPPDARFPGMRYVLLHSISHALMRQIALECGYTAASLRERLYSRHPGQENGPMAGILVYTAASDSEGTLGGLVNLGQPISLGRHISQALESMRICASDPLCAEHEASDGGRTVHGACCHACLFAPETSCEKGNRLLDRSVLVSTFAGKAVEFFSGV
jgi:MrfA Zn-binding domain